MPHLIHEDDDKTFACPECDGAPVWERNGPTKEVAKFSCNACPAQFDEPVERTKKAPSNRGIASPQLESAQKLIDADPDSTIAWGGR